MKRGSDIASELENAERLLTMGAGETWGWSTPSGKERVRRRVEFIARELDMRAGRRFLELGCGTGLFTRHLARTGASIVAVDIAPRLHEVARAEVPESNVEFVVGDLMDPASRFGDGFDGFYGVSVLHHLDLARALPVIAARLKPGARFAVSEPNIENPINKYYYFTKDVERRKRAGMSETEMAFEPSELAGALAAHGFRVESLAHRDFLHPETPRALIGVIDRIGRLAERIPRVQRWSGSLWCAGSLPQPHSNP